jgi:hypothetical protein
MSLKVTIKLQFKPDHKKLLIKKTLALDISLSSRRKGIYCSQTNYFKDSTMAKNEMLYQVSCRGHPEGLFYL